MTIQKITEKATCFFWHLAATVQHHLPTSWQHGWNIALAFPQQNHLDQENMQEKLVSYWNPRMFGGVWIIWALVKMFASHFQNRFQDKSPTVDIKTCLLHSVSVALSKQKKNMEGRYRDSLNAGMSAMAMLHSVSNCVCYGGQEASPIGLGSFPKLFSFQPDRLFLKSWIRM